MFLCLLLTGCSHPGKREEKGEASRFERGEGNERQREGETDFASHSPSIPSGAGILLECYPECIKGYEEGYLVMSDGSRILYDDGKEKGFVEMLDDSDPEDMFRTHYRSRSLPPGYCEDAGRSRCEALFKSMYGSDAESVRRNLEMVEWFGTKVPFTKVNGASGALRKVAEELSREPELRQYLKSSGTFYWRKVRGANRQSAHSYGIAIDVGVEHSDYWLWKNPGAGEESEVEYANRMPRKLVDIFERHGFIWGGAWYHYDTMHFEYRPEILKNAR